MSTPSKMAVTRQARECAEELQTQYRLTQTGVVTVFSAFSAVGLHGMLWRRQNFMANGILGGFFGAMALTEGTLLFRTWDCKPNDPEVLLAPRFGGPTVFRPAQWEVETISVTEKSESYKLHVDGPRRYYPRDTATFDETFETK